MILSRRVSLSVAVLAFGVSNAGPNHAAERTTELGVEETRDRAAYFPPPDSAGGWRTAKKAVQAREWAGIDPHQLEQAWNFTQRCTQNGGLLVVRNGYLVS